MARSRPDAAQKRAKVPDNIGKRVVFDLQTWQAVDLLARDRMMTFQELADEAFNDVLRKHGRPYDTRDALKRSVRMAQANDNPGKQVRKNKTARR